MVKIIGRPSRKPTERNRSGRSSAWRIEARRLIEARPARVARNAHRYSPGTGHQSARAAVCRVIAPAVVLQYPSMLRDDPGRP